MQRGHKEGKMRLPKGFRKVQQGLGDDASKVQGKKGAIRRKQESKWRNEGAKRTQRGCFKAQETKTKIINRGG